MQTQMFNEVSIGQTVESKNGIRIKVTKIRDGFVIGEDLTELDFKGKPQTRILSFKNFKA